MILTDLDLRSEVQAGRIVFDPPIVLKDPKRQIGPASIDLHLGINFWVPREFKFKIDPLETSFEAYCDKQVEEDKFELGPGKFVISQTLEAIGLSNTLAAWVQGRSGIARHGLIIHCTAPFIEPGFGFGPAGPKRLYLEIKNLGTATLTLKPKEHRLCQLIFVRVTSPPIYPKK